MAGRTRVFLEVGGKRTFASAADWPGWSRSGRDETAALANLAAYAPRYARVVKLARLELPEDATSFTVVERLKGNATTDFGAPGVPAQAESKPLTAAEAKRMIGLLEASWKYLDQVRAKVPKELRKGPRGGGRDRDKMYDHIVEAELGYSPAIGVRVKKHDRAAMVEGLKHPVPGAKWSPAYAARRIAWHALDHAWEMEDRIP